MKKHNPLVHDSVLELRKDTEALKHLKDLEELESVPPSRGGYHFSNWEREFIKSTSAAFDATPVFSDAQRQKIKEIWQAADLRGRAGVDKQAENLFSKLSPARQAEQRERAKGILPWEK